MRIIEVGHLRAAHAVLVERHQIGEQETPVGPLDKRAIAGWDSIIGSLHPVFGVDKYPTAEEKAARVLFAGATTQHLMDGNKRITTLLAILQLEINDRRFTATNNELEAFVLSISTRGNADADEITAEAAQWIREHSEPTD